MFNSRTILTQKPDGLYLTPFFTGDTDAGHWYLIAIQKTKAFYDAHIIDSCNFSHTDNKNHRKILSAFAPNRGRFIWTTGSTIPQTETECGSRTIVTMQACCQGLAREMHMKDIVKEALHNFFITGEYDANDIRDSAVLVIRQYRETMCSYCLSSREAMEAGERSKHDRALERNREHQRRKGRYQNYVTKNNENILTSYDMRMNLNLVMPMGVKV